MAGRWAIDWPDDTLSASNDLGDHAAARFRHVRRFVEALNEDQVDVELFGLLLNIEGMKDEMRAYEEQTSRLLRLAQTGHFVRQIQRLHGALDAISAQYEVSKPVGRSAWELALESERSARVKRYDAMLSSQLEGGSMDSEGGESELLKETASEEQQEEVLTLLKAAIDKHTDDHLTQEEIEITTKAFQFVADRSGVVFMELPSWLVMPFEFSSTFGLSRWGNDLLVPNHPDRSRFIRDANVWSSLNHPHVVKFLGACHVGSRPFIVHERVRPLSEWVGEEKERQQVWCRLYEIALALQYLHERGLGCVQLGLDDVYCAEFESKAMVFGVGLAGFGDRNQLRRSSQVGRDLAALGVVAVDCFRKMASSSRKKTPQSRRKDQDTRGEATSAMPTTRPDFVEETEWATLLDIQKVDVSSSAAMLYAIERFKDFAGIAQGKNWFDDSGVLAGDHAVAGGVIRIDSVSVPVVNGRRIPDILAECASMMGQTDPARRIQKRLADICAQLAPVELQASDDSVKELIARFSSLVVRLYRFMEQKSCSKAPSQFGMSQREPMSLFAFHSDIDRLIATFNSLLSSSGEHAWALEGVSPIPEQQPLDFKDGSTGQSSSLDIQSVRGCLSAGPSDKGGGQSNLTRQQLQTERWFIPSDEVEFKSFAEFSRGAFGSVHHGRWYDTPVVVKSIFVDTDNLEATQAQFIKEANIWFQLNHINVVKMYGACHVDQPFFLCEFASNGDLSSYLEKKGREPYLIWYSLLNAALGLQYLHGKGIVHADLKADNILVGADEIAKLTDFGLSVSARPSDEDDEEEAGGALGAYRWKAPECLPSHGTPGHAATIASDVYSFAMVMIEAVSGSFPWGSTMPDAAVSFHVKKGRLPPRPAEMEKSEWRLIERMCCLDPAERVTMDAVVVHLSSMLERLDISRLWPMIDKIDKDVPVVIQKNRVMSRGGALLSLMELAKSTNTEVASYALEHILAIHVSRGMRAEERELEALIAILEHGNASEKTWAVEAMLDLTWNSVENTKLVAAANGIPPLVDLVRSGDDVQKENAAGALWNLSTIEDNRVRIAAGDGIPPLVALVRDGNDAQKENAAGTLWELSSSNGTQAMIVSSGGIPPLMELVNNGTKAQKEKAAGALACLLANNSTTKVLIASSGGIPPLVKLMADGNDAQKEYAASALWNLSTIEDNRARIAACDGISPLVALVRDGSDVQKEKAAGALWSLSVNEDNKKLIGLNGGIPPLVALVRGGNDEQKKNACGALWSLSAKNTVNKTLIASSGGISALVELIRDSNDAIKESAAGALWSLAASDTDNKLLIASNGGIPPLVALTHAGNDMQKVNAAGALLSLLMNEDVKAVFVASGGTLPLVALVRDGSDMQKGNACLALWNLAFQNASGAARIVSDGGMEPLVALLVNGTEELKARAAGVLGFLDHDIRIKTMIAENGGIAALLKFIQGSNDDDGILEGLVALQRLCCEGNCVVHDSLAAADGISILTTIAQSTNGAHRELASVILADLLGKKACCAEDSPRVSRSMRSHCTSSDQNSQQEA